MGNKTEDVLDEDDEYIRNEANDKEYFQLSLQKKFLKMMKIKYFVF